MRADLRLPALAVMLLLAQPGLAAAGQVVAAGQAAGFMICLLLGCRALWHQRNMLAGFASKLSRLAAGEVKNHVKPTA
ncbi:MAG: hypothetical protein FJX33_10990 [Alphaproteobacteria bacterium]|nr:hypothetical protein [Alphaproteobacteria bacterium]